MERPAKAAKLMTCVSCDAGIVRLPAGHRRLSSGVVHVVQGHLVWRREESVSLWTIFGSHVGYSIKCPPLQMSAQRG